MKDFGLPTPLIDRNGNRLCLGDIVKAPVKRLSSSHSSWWRMTGKHHGIFYLNGVLSFRSGRNGANFYIDFNKKDIEELKSPKGRERFSQCVDTINIKWKEIELVSRPTDKQPEDIEEFDMEFLEI